MAGAQELIHIGRYEIKRVLGKGAMGIVYEGLDPKLHRQVAIKTILLDQLDKDSAHDYAVRFVREAQAVARLNHPNIVRVFDFGEEDAVAYIVMEFIKGKELKDYFDNHHQFQIPDIVRIMCELLGALEVAHEHHIIHRDVKPANVMMDSQGRAMLTDFGVARVADVDRTHVERTAVGTVVGTPSYMSPEQISGESVDHRTDLFSAGIVLYQFLTGEKPFTGEGAWTIARKIMSEDPRRPSDINVAIPKEYDNVIWRALAKTPEQRYANAREFSDALKRVLAGGPAEVVTKQAPAAPYDPDATLLAPMEDPLAAPMRPTPGDTRPGGLPQQARQAPEAKVTNDAELEFWLAIKDSDDAEDFDLYVQQFPTGLYADLARRKVRKLQQGAAAANEASSTQIRAREALQLQEDTARNEAEAIATREAEEQARQQEQARVRREADLVARQEAEAKAQREAEEIAKAEAAARAKREAEERAQLEAEAKAKREAEELARLEAQAKAKREAEELARLEAEAKAQREAEEKARLEAQAKAKREGEERARLEAEAKAKREAEEKALIETQAKAKREAQEKARLEAEAKAQREAEEIAKAEAAARVKREAEEKAWLEAEAKAKREAEEKARLEAEAKAKREAEEKALLEAQAKAKAKREAEELARLEAEAKAKREDEERARLEAQAKAKREAEELARKAAEEKAKLEAQAKVKREAEELAQLEADAKAKREAEEKARLEAQAKAKREAEERARLADEAKAKREADEKARVAVRAHGQVQAGVAHAESPDVQQQSAAAPVKKNAMLVPAIVAVLALLGGGGYMMFGRSAAPSLEVVRTPEATPKTTTAPAPVSPAQPAPKVEVAKADQDAGLLAAKRQADEKAKRDADEADHRDAADKAKKDSADKTKSEAKRLADEKAKKDADEKTKTEAEAKRLTDDQAKKDAVEKAKNEAEAKRLAGEKTKKDAEDRAKREADEKVKVAALTPVPEAADPPKSVADVNALMEQGLAAEKGGRMGEAVRFYKQASAAGSGIAAKRLGDIYGKGSDGVPRSYQESLRYLEIARARGVDVPKTVSK